MIKPDGAVLREGSAQEKEYQGGGKYRQSKENIFLHIYLPLNHAYSLLPLLLNYMMPFLPVKCQEKLIDKYNL
ncbi:MAG: hypothetical protein ACLPVI_10590 [Dehalococcoidales bacterium]